MAFFSSPTVAHPSTLDGGHRDHLSSDAHYHPLRPEDPDFLRPDEEEDDVVDAVHPSPSLETEYVAMEDTAATSCDVQSGENEIDASRENAVIPVEDVRRSPESIETSTGPATILCCFGKLRIQERTLGILAALFFTGIWGGSIMVPMQFAPKIDKGLPYLTSFAIGAAIVNISLWIVRYLYLCQKYSSMAQAYKALPSFHLRKMWFYGGLCGLLWSIGNFFSILAVEFLGEGVGYSTTQASMLVSGFWGIFYFHEVEGFGTICKWFASAMITVLGILLLSYEHHEK